MQTNKTVSWLIANKDTAQVIIDNTYTTESRSVYLTRSKHSLMLPSFSRKILWSDLARDLVRVTTFSYRLRLTDHADTHL